MMVHTKHVYRNVYGPHVNNVLTVKISSMVANNACCLQEDVCGLHSKYYAKHLCTSSLQRQWVTCRDMLEMSFLPDYKCSSSNKNVVTISS